MLTKDELKFLLACGGIQADVIDLIMSENCSPQAQAPKHEIPKDASNDQTDSKTRAKNEIQVEPKEPSAPKKKEVKRVYRELRPAPPPDRQIQGDTKGHSDTTSQSNTKDRDEKTVQSATTGWGDSEMFGESLFDFLDSD